MKFLDFLVKKYPGEPRERLFSAVLCGDFKVGGGVLRDPKAEIAETAAVERSGGRYVSRGALKLERALDLWPLPVAGRVFIDAGASTGGFTEVLLRRRAALVYAVDVGFNQLAFALRSDPRTVVMEKTNVLSLTPESFSRQPHAAVADISFRSVIEPAVHLFRLISGDEAVVLLKPQFEWKNPPPRFDGVIRKTADLKAVVRDFFAEVSAAGLFVRAVALSPVKGSKGNTEFLLLLHRTEGLDDPYAAAEALADGG